MRQNKYRYQIGDVLYEPSKMYNRVIEWKITDIFVEGYYGGYKTTFGVRSEFLGIKEQFITDVIHWYDTYEEAAEKLCENGIYRREE